MEAITYVSITQNRVENLRRNLSRILPYVDKAVIIDGGSVDGSVEYCKTHPKVQVFHRKWDDSFALQYNEYLKHIKDGWIFICDDDELPSEDLLKNLRRIVNESGLGNIYSSVEFRSWSINSDDDIPKDHPDDHWRVMLFRYQPGMRYTIDLHQHLSGYQNNKLVRSNLIYEHIKSAKDVARNACRNYFIAGIWLPNASDGLRELEWKSLRDTISSCYPEVKVFSDLNSLFVKGNIHEDLKQWMIKYKDYGSNLYHELHHFFEYYFEMLHPQEYTEDIKAQVTQTVAEKKFIEVSLSGDTWSPSGDTRSLGLAVSEVSYLVEGEWTHRNVLSPDMELQGFNGVEGGNSGSNFSWSSDSSIIRLYGIDSPPEMFILKFVWQPRPGQQVVVRLADKEAVVERDVVVL